MMNMMMWFTLERLPSLRCFYEFKTDFLVVRTTVSLRKMASLGKGEVEQMLSCGVKRVQGA